MRLCSCGLNTTYRDFNKGMAEWVKGRSVLRLLAKALWVSTCQDLDPATPS